MVWEGNYEESSKYSWENLSCEKTVHTFELFQHQKSTFLLIPFSHKLFERPLPNGERIRKFASFFLAKTKKCRQSHHVSSEKLAL